MSGVAVFDAISRCAAEAVGAAGVALVGRDGDELRVLAVTGEETGRSVGETVSGSDQSIGFAIASAQTISLGPQSPSSESGGVHRAPSASLTVPCLAAEGVMGAIEIRAAPGSGSFSPEAGRIAALFADIAGAALQEPDSGTLSVATAPELAGELTRLAEADPARYAVISSVIGALLAHG
jgi:hypothetical protein